MSRDRSLIGEFVSQHIRQGTAVDIYAIVETLKPEFPDVEQAELERIVSEEVIASHANAFWHRRSA